MKNKGIYHMLTLLLMIVWGLSYFFINLAQKEVTPGALAFYRFLIASILLIIINKAKKYSFKVEKGDLIRFIFAGFFGISLYFLFENTAVNFTKVSNISILIATIPIINLLSEIFFYKIKFTKRKIIGVFLSFLGILFIIMSTGEISFSSKDFIGDILILGAALCWVVYTQITYRIKNNYPSLIVTMYQSIFGTIFLLPFVFGHNIFSYNLKTYMSIVYLSVFCSIIAYFLYVECQKHLGAVVVTTYVNVQPVIGILSGFFMLNEKITIYQIIGAIIILSGVYMVSSKK